MLLSGDNCPCGSGKRLEQCCLPEHPPISKRQEGYSSISLMGCLLDEEGNQYTIPSDLSVSTGIRKKQQLDSVISDVVNKAFEVVYPNLKKDKFSYEVWPKLHILYDCLHKVRYHQHQFLFRLRLLTGEHVLLSPTITGNSSVVLEDFPLSCELEAFLSGIRSVLDVLSKVASLKIYRDVENVTHGKFFHNITKKKIKKDRIGNKLREVYTGNQSWMNEIKELRDAIQHDGTCYDYESFKFDKGRLFEPTINNLNAQNLCLKYWASLINFVNVVLETVIIEEKQL